MRHVLLVSVILVGIIASTGARPNNDNNDCFCIEIFDPVCGTDGITYGNSCKANCNRIPIECKSECPCKGDSNPKRPYPPGRPNRPGRPGHPGRPNRPGRPCTDPIHFPRPGGGNPSRQPLPQPQQNLCDCCRAGTVPTFCAAALVDCSRCRSQNY